MQVEALPAAVPAYRAPKNTVLVRAALAAIRATGGKPRFVVKTGTSDMNMVAPTWRCPTIAYGPGNSNLDHTREEHISLVEFQRSIVVLRTILDRLSSAGA
jgi:LysW-gamma-L-lysine carboxypeptidase